MVQKRPFDNEDTHAVCYKQPRHSKQCDQVASFSEHAWLEAASRSHSSADDGKHQTNTIIKPPTNLGNVESCIQHDEILGIDTISELLTPDEDIEPCAAGRVSVSSWATSGTSDDDDVSYAPFHASHFPACLSPEGLSGGLVHNEDIYSLLLECAPQKPVPVGPNHQADITEWNSHVSTSNTPIGTCVIPMEAPICAIENVGNGRTDCNCQDMGSIRCVRQHIMEAREKLIRTVGHEKFVELGFSDMGEQVLKKWTEDEGHLFHEVVYTNPASLYKNFWEILFRVFPDRTKKDIVSYYFNVLMLRRRAEQNRRDPNNTDSDNDEGHGSHEYGGNELDMSEEDEDYDVESLGYEHDVPHKQRLEDDDEYYREVADDTCDDKIMDRGSPRGNNVPETSMWNFLNNGGSDPTAHLQNKIPWDQEIQEDSCTSTDTEPALQATPRKISHSNQ